LTYWCNVQLDVYNDQIKGFGLAHREKRQPREYVSEGLSPPVCRLPSVASALLSKLPLVGTPEMCVPQMCASHVSCAPRSLRCGCAQVWNADRDRTGRELSEIQDNGDFEEGRLRYKLFEDLYRSFILDVVAPGYSPSLCSLCCSLCCSYVAL